MELKLLRKIVSRINYLLIGFWLPCFLVGTLWATEINAQQKSEKLDAQRSLTITGKVISGDDNQGLPGVIEAAKPGRWPETYYQNGPSHFTWNLNYIT